MSQASPKDAKWVVASTLFAIVSAFVAHAFEDRTPAGDGKNTGSSQSSVQGVSNIPTQIVPPAASAARRTTRRAQPTVQRTGQSTDDPMIAPADDAQADAAGASADGAVDESPYPRPRYGGLHDYDRGDRRFLNNPRYRGYRRWGYGYYAGGALRDAYDAGREDERLDVQRRFNEEDTDHRRDRALTAHDEALERGLALLAAGDYRGSAAALTLAARLDEGDPVCRVHLAQAKLALGQFDDAGRTLRRGLELQPELALMPLDLARQYPRATDLDAHVAGLATAVQARRTGVEGVFLLGFLEYQRGHTDAAHRHLAQVMNGKHRDLLVRELLDVTRPAIAAGSR